MKIEVQPPEDESLQSQLISLYLAFKDTEGQTLFDLSRINWLFPLLILPVAAYIQDTDSDFICPGNPDVRSYLETVRFPSGVESVSEMQKEKSYVPLIVLRKSRFQEREHLRDCFAEMVYRVLEPTVDVRNAVYYPITELVENIFEHSLAEKGYLFAQHYPKKGFVDLCIADRGRGIAASYKKEKGLDFSDREALIESLKGLSVKQEKGRGYGIRTSRRVICEGLGGELVMISGKAALCASRREILYDLSPFCWKGVIVAYRIPKPDRPVDIYQFLE
jgi:hypothetical protein